MITTTTTTTNNNKTNSSYCHERQQREAGGEQVNPDAREVRLGVHGVRAEPLYGI